MSTNLYSSSLINRLQACNNDEPILIQGGKSIYAKDVYERSVQLATNLAQLGFRKDDRVVIAAEPGVEFLLIIYANILLRTKLAIIDPEMGREHYKNKLIQWDPKWAFVDARLLLLNEHPVLKWFYLRSRKSNISFPRLKHMHCISTGYNLPIISKHTKIKGLLKKQNTPLEIRKDSTDHDFIVTYTSGTTSTPKGVLHSFSGLEKSFQHIVQLMGDPTGQSLANHLPHFMLIGINAGIPVHLWNYEASAKEKIEFLESKKITTLFGPPSDYLELIEYCAESGRKLPDTLQHIIIGSAPVYKAFLEKVSAFLPAHTKISSFYGMTENLVVSYIDGREKMNYKSDGDPLGKPVNGIELRIAKDSEIFVKSEQLFSRYWHMEDRPEWHATGDLGYLDENGYLIMTGRKKDMILRRNQNIYPGLYEPTIHKIPGVKAAAMIGVYNEKKFDEEVFVVVEGESDMDESSVRKALELGEYSIDKEALPDHIIFMKIPRKGRQNKIDKTGLRVLIQSSNGSQ